MVKHTFDWTDEDINDFLYCGREGYKVSSTKIFKDIEKKNLMWLLRNES